MQIHFLTYTYYFNYVLFIYLFTRSFILCNRARLRKERGFGSTAEEKRCLNLLIILLYFFMLLKTYFNSICIWPEAAAFFYF